MLRRLVVEGFKSFQTLGQQIPRFTVLFGTNAAGKSNFLDALQALSRIGTERTLRDALSDPVRGHPVELFEFPAGGLPALLQQRQARFSLGADVVCGEKPYRYKVEVSIDPKSGRLSIADEYLALLNKKGEERGNPAIQRKDGQLFIRRKSKPAHPRQEPLGGNHSTLSDPRLGGVEYQGIEQVRKELAEWRTYYLDPRVAMRAATPPSDVSDIGVLGRDIAPFLYKLRAEAPVRFEALKRALRSLVPSVEDVSVDLDVKRGTLDLTIRQDDVPYSSRIVSEGTLRVLALCAIAVNPWGGSLVAFEEPENGVHPRRIELIGELLLSLALDGQRQVVVTTHSPLFCDAILRRARQCEGAVGLFNVRREGRATVVTELDEKGPLFTDKEIREALTAGREDGLFEALLLRGFIDG